MKSKMANLFIEKVPKYILDNVIDENEMGLAIEKDHYDPPLEQGFQYQLSVRESYKDTIKNHEDVIRKQEREIEVLKKKNSELETKVANLSEVWEFDQAFRLCNPSSQCHWSDNTLEKCIKLYYFSF